MSRQAHLVWEIGAELGEGPIWVGRDQALWFTDIKKRQVHRVDPENGDQRSWEAPAQIGFLFPAKSGGFIAGLQGGLHRFDPKKGTFTLLVAVEPDHPTNRLNDGVVDPSGRLWFGTMDDTERNKTGAYYCFCRGKLTRTNLTGIAITNGPAVSPDGKILYWVDTLGGTISSCEIWGDGQLGPSQLVVRIDPNDGLPDGPTVDSEGGIWISLYSGWEARRYSPAGELMERVRFPVSNITKVAFGGADLRTAFATTARHLLKPEQLNQQPLAGSLFAFAAGAPGVASPPVDD
jgi:sugar lactone lactonase YvrE